MDIESVSVRILYGHNNEGPSAKSFYKIDGWFPKFSLSGGVLVMQQLGMSACRLALMTLYLPLRAVR